LGIGLSSFPNPLALPQARTADTGIAPWPLLWEIYPHMTCGGLAGSEPLDLRDQPVHNRRTWRWRDLAALVAVAVWSVLIVELFPAPVPAPPAIPYSLARLR